MFKKRILSPSLGLSTLVIWATVLGLASPLAAAPPDPDVPTVRFDYHFVPFDRACSALGKSEIPEARIEELEARRPEFQQYWDEHGPRLLETVVAITGQPFERRDVVAVMSLCTFPSMSHPLLINMRRFLDSGPEDPPRAKFLFTALVLHELLHVYVVDHLADSPLKKKYSAEAGSVLSHLHLMALMKAIYLELGLKSELDAIIAKDQQIPRDVYRRSWEIVNDLEGYQPFVDELRTQPNAWPIAGVGE